MKPLFGIVKAGIEAQRLLIVLNATLALALELEDDAAIVLSERALGFVGDGSVEVGQRKIKLLSVEVGIATIIEDERALGVESDSWVAGGVTHETRKRDA